MGVFEDTLVKAKELLDMTGDKVGEVIDTQKIKYNIARTNSELSKDYELLGRLYYSQLKKDNVDKEAIDGVIAEIELLKDNLRVYEIELTLSKGGCVCEECGSANGVDADFCAKCGKPL